jgi:hypothetical protein
MLAVAACSNNNFWLAIELLMFELELRHFQNMSPNLSRWTRRETRLPLRVALKIHFTVASTFMDNTAATLDGKREW